MEFCTFDEFLACLDGEPKPVLIKEHAILFKPSLVRAIAIVEPVTALDRSIYFDQWIKLWDSINKSRGFDWEGNPVVTVVEFKRVAE